MRHVAQIKEIVASGDVPKAHEALEDLLALGPNNLEALKLKAQLFAREGRFLEEAKIWDRVLQVDREDPDAISFLFKQQAEDREHFYFTDHLPGGARRYLAYPKSLVTTSILGLLGCIIFLTLTKLGDNFPLLNQAHIMLASFGIFVLTPWLAIIYNYLRSLKHITISQHGIEIASRFRTLDYKWNDLERVSLAHDLRSDSADLSLVIVPRDKQASALKIDMNDDSSSIRAKGHLINEITLFFDRFYHEKLSTILLSERNVLHY